MEFERREGLSEVMASPVLHTFPEKIWFCCRYEHSILKEGFCLAASLLRCSLTA